MNFKIESFTNGFTVINDKDTGDTLIGFKLGASRIEKIIDEVNGIESVSDLDSLLQIHIDNIIRNECKDKPDENMEEDAVYIFSISMSEHCTIDMFAKIIDLFSKLQERFDNCYHNILALIVPKIPESLKFAIVMNLKHYPATEILKSTSNELLSREIFRNANEMGLPRIFPYLYTMVVKADDCFISVETLFFSEQDLKNLSSGEHVDYKLFSSARWNSLDSFVEFKDKDSYYCNGGHIYKMINDGGECKLEKISSGFAKKNVKKFINDALTRTSPHRAVILEDVGDNVKSDTYLFKSSHDLHAYLLGKNVYKKLIHTTKSTESMVREFNCLEKNVYRLVDGKWHKKAGGSFEAVKFSFLDKIKSIVYKIENMVRN